VIALLLGLVSLLAVMGALGMFSRAQVSSIKSMGVWVAAIGGLLLAAMLFLTGRGSTAIAALIMLGPLVWSWVTPEGRGESPGPSRTNSRPKPGAMTRAEAYEILGLKPGSDAEAVRAAHRRLMQAAHPDHGGSDWLAARINQARDVLIS
jgi:hypothetical protein